MTDVFFYICLKHRFLPDSMLVLFYFFMLLHARGEGQEWGKCAHIWTTGNSSIFGNYCHIPKQGFLRFKSKHKTQYTTLNISLK